MTVYHGKVVQIVGTVESEHVPFSDPEAITDVRLLWLSVPRDNPGHSISIANKEQSLISIMTYVVCVGIAYEFY